jgi:ParB family chromosome partitioning protein
MTRYLAVARGVPRPLAQAIGPAPRAGRPRWMELAALLAADDDAAEAAVALARSPDVQSAPSDRRFDIVLSALRRRTAATAPGGSEGVPWAPVLGPGGDAVIKLEPLAAGTRLTVLEQAAPGLSAFLVARLPALLAEFLKDRRRPGPDRAEDDRAS